MSTPADMARAVVEHLIAQGVRDVNTTDQRLRDAIATSLQAERAAGWREAAGFLQDMADHGDGEVDPEEIAAALRARGEEAGA